MNFIISQMTHDWIKCLNEVGFFFSFAYNVWLITQIYIRNGFESQYSENKIVMRNG